MSEPTEIWAKNLKDQFLECPICIETYNDTDRRPRLLQVCLHALCTECLDTLIQKEGRGQLTCPLCRHVTQIKGKASSFPTDPLRSKLLDFVKLKKEKKAMCSDCPDGNEADSRCQECSVFLCEECRNAHKRHKTTRNHSVLDLEQVLEQPLKQLSTRHFCTKHPDHKLEFFCSTDESLCCLSCTVLDHQGHKFEKIEEALIPRQRDLDSRLQNTKRHALSLRDQRQRVEKNKATILQDKMTTTGEIQKQFSKLQKLIKMQKESLLKDVEQNSQEKVAFCDKNIQAIDESLATIESTQSYIAHANQNSDAVEMLQMLPALKQSLTGSSHPSSPGAAEQTPRVVFDPCFVSTAEKLIPLIGQLEVQSGADQPSGARDYRDCVQQVMSVCLDSRDRTELRRRINQQLGEVGQQEQLSSTAKDPKLSQVSQKRKPVKTGARMPGRMTSSVIRESCGGYEDFNTIQINYNIPAGSSNTSSGSPAQSYDEVDYTAYLPNNGEGQKVLSLLKVAWERGLTFKLEEGWWSIQISHKEYFGNYRNYRRDDSDDLNYRDPSFEAQSYPDPTYLQKVQEELRQLGVTEEDI